MSPTSPRRPSWALALLALLALPLAAEEPVLRFRDSVKVREDARVAEIEVFVTTAPDRPARFLFSTVDGDAKAGEDYVAQIDKTFETTTFARLRIQLVDDRFAESEEYFYVDIRNVENAVTTTTRIPILIQDDGVIPAPEFGATIAKEGDRDKTVEVFLSLDTALDLNFSMRVYSTPITARSRADFDPVDTNVIFNAGKRTGSFLVTIRGDDYTEPDETFALHLEGGETVIFTIQDDDEPNSFPTISIDDAAVFEGAAETSVMRFRVSLSEPPPHGARVDYETAESSAKADEDFTPVKGTLVFAPGQVLNWIEVPISDDAEDEGSEWLYVDLSDPFRANLRDESGAGAIRDDDMFRARYLFVHGATGVEGGKAIFRLELSKPSTEPITLRWSAAEPETGTTSSPAARGRDYPGLLESITFLPGETVKQIAVPLFHDTEAEGDEYFNLYFQPFPAGIDERTFPALGVILDDDKAWEWPQLRVDDVKLVESDGWTEARLTLMLARASETEARVVVEAAEATATAFEDFAPERVEVIFEPGQTKQTVSLRLGGDVLREPLEHFTIHLSEAQGLTIVRDEASVTIVDDDGGTRPRAVRPR